MSSREKGRINRMKLEVNYRVELAGARLGKLKYMGSVEFGGGASMMFGFELIDGSIGEHNGTVEGVKYFECPERRGIFVESSQLRKKLRKPKVESVQDVYRRKITKIFEEFNRTKIKAVDGLLKKHEKKEHELYLKICK